jgi:hypothetical protein
MIPHNHRKKEFYKYDTHNNPLTKLYEKKKEKEKEKTRTSNKPSGLPASSLERPGKKKRKKRKKWTLRAK